MGPPSFSLSPQTRRMSSLSIYPLTRKGFLLSLSLSPPLSLPLSLSPLTRTVQVIELGEECDGSAEAWAGTFTPYIHVQRIAALGHWVCPWYKSDNLAAEPPDEPN